MTYGSWAQWRRRAAAIERRGGAVIAGLHCSRQAPPHHCRCGLCKPVLDGWERLHGGDFENAAVNAEAGRMMAGL
jgi:hypothetical protein